MAGFDHAALAEIDSDACATLRGNRREWKVLEGDIRLVDGRQFAGVDLMSGGVPCQPFSTAGWQLGARDERDLFGQALRLIGQARPRAVLLENVPGLLRRRFEEYRAQITRRLEELGYHWDWRILQASDYGVAQLRPRAVLVALAGNIADFAWPDPGDRARTVGEVLGASMAARGWAGANAWTAGADRVAPTIAGGSRLHGGADLGPSRAKREWRDQLGTNAFGLADEVPGPGGPPRSAAQVRQGTAGMPKLTVRQAALLQGFPPGWEFAGGKTSAYRQVGQAFPPPVAAAVGEAIARTL